MFSWGSYLWSCGGADSSGWCPARRLGSPGFIVRQGLSGAAGHSRTIAGVAFVELRSVTCECHLRVVLVVVVLWCCAAGSDRRRAVAIRAPVWCRTALFWCCQPWPGSWAPCCAVYLCFSGWCNLRAVSYPLPLSVFSSDIYICAIC